MEESRHISVELGAHSSIYTLSVEKEKQIPRKVRVELEYPGGGYI